MSLFKKVFINNVILTIFLLGFLAGALMIWIFGGSKYSDFGLNLFTEILGVIITVYIINKILEKRLNKFQ